jgi:YD repeat-containing protein
MSGLKLFSKAAHLVCVFPLLAIFNLTPSIAAGETVANAPSGMNGSISYSLDPVGNRLSDVSTLGPVPSAPATTYNADDQSQAETSDAAGNTISTAGRSYAYNSWLKLVSMNGGQVTLAYNGLGQLVSKTASGVTTQYLTDDLSPTGYPQVVAEVVNGQPVRTYNLRTGADQRTADGEQFADRELLPVRRPGHGAGGH